MGTGWASLVQCQLFSCLFRCPGLLLPLQPPNSAAKQTKEPSRAGWWAAELWGRRPASNTSVIQLPRRGRETSPPPKVAHASPPAHERRTQAIWTAASRGNASTTPENSIDTQRNLNRLKNWPDSSKT